MFDRGIYHDDPEKVDGTTREKGCAGSNVIYGINYTVCKKRGRRFTLDWEETNRLWSISTVIKSVLQVWG